MKRIAKATRQEEMICGAEQVPWPDRRSYSARKTHAPKESTSRRPLRSGHTGLPLRALRSVTLPPNVLGDQPRSQRQLVALPRQRQRLDLAQRQERNGSFRVSPRSSGGRACGRARSAASASLRCRPSAHRGLLCRCQQGEVVARQFLEAEPRCVVLRLEASQLIGARFSRAGACDRHRRRRWQLVNAFSV